MVPTGAGGGESQASFLRDSNRRSVRVSFFFVPLRGTHPLCLRGTGGRCSQWWKTRCGF